MEFIGKARGYTLFKNNQGFIEGYKSTGRGLDPHSAKEIHRVVTTATTIEEFYAFTAKANNSPHPPQQQQNRSLTEQ